MYFFTYALSKKQTHPNELIKSRTGNPFPREKNKQKKIHTFFFKVRDDKTNAPIGALEVCNFQPFLYHDTRFRAPKFLSNLNLCVIIIMTENLLMLIS